MRSSSAIDRRRALGILTLAALGSGRAAVAGQGKVDGTPAKGAANQAIDPASVDAIDIVGRPDAKTQGDDSRIVLWRDTKEGNLHLQGIARGANPKTFLGTIVAVGGAIRNVEGLETLESAKMTKKGAVKNADTADRVQWKKDTLEFRFHTVGGKTDEIAIRITPETTHLKLTLRIDAKSAREQIFLGKAGAHPARDTVIVPLER